MFKTSQLAEIFSVKTLSPLTSRLVEVFSVPTLSPFKLTHNITCVNFKLYFPILWSSPQLLVHGNNFWELLMLKMLILQAQNDIRLVTLTQVSSMKSQCLSCKFICRSQLIELWPVHWAAPQNMSQQLTASFAELHHVSLFLFPYPI